MDFLKNLNPINKLIYYPVEEVYPIFQRKIYNVSDWSCSCCFWWNLCAVEQTSLHNTLQLDDGAG